MMLIHIQLRGISNYFGPVTVLSVFIYTIIFHLLTIFEVGTIIHIWWNSKPINHPCLHLLLVESVLKLLSNVPSIKPEVLSLFPISNSLINWTMCSLIMSSYTTDIFHKGFVPPGDISESASRGNRWEEGHSGDRVIYMSTLLLPYYWLNSIF